MTLLLIVKRVKMEKVEVEFTVDDYKSQLIALLQGKKFIEFERLIELVSKKEKISKTALKKEIKEKVNEDFKKSIANLTGQYKMPSGFFIKDDIVFREIKDGVTYVCEFCTVAEIHRTNDNAESIFTINFQKTNRSISFKSDEFVDNKLLETILLNHGVYIGDKLKDFKSYVSGFIRMNIDVIPTVIRVNRTGWQNVAVDDKGQIRVVNGYCNPILKPALTYIDSITDTIYREGDIVTATEIVKTGVRYKGSCLAILSGLAATLIKPLAKQGLGNFVVNFSGDTGQGKTLSSRIGLSMFGNAQESNENSLINSMSSTAVGGELLFAQFMDMPILLDEAGTIKGTAEKKAQHIIEIIFQFFSGTGKTRGQRNLTLRKTERSRGVLFLTMEYDLKTVEKIAGVTEKGYFRRTIEVDSTSGNFLPDKEIYDFGVINSNFGFVAEIFVNSILKHYELIKDDFDRYEKELRRVELRGKEKYFAVLFTVLENLKRIGLIGEIENAKAKEILMLVYKENLQTMQDITTNKVSLWAETLLEWIAINRNKFENDDGRERWGEFSINKYSAKEEIHIFPTILANFCMEKGINERSFCKEMSDKGAIVTELTTHGLRMKVKRRNIAVFCFKEQVLNELIMKEHTIIEIQQNVENAIKYQTENLTIDNNGMLIENGEVLF